jgi:hypothetical protein
MLIAAIKPSELPEYGNSAEALVCDTLKRWNYNFWNFIQAQAFSDFISNESWHFVTLTNGIPIKHNLTLQHRAMETNIYWSISYCYHWALTQKRIAETDRSFFANLREVHVAVPCFLEFDIQIILQ